MGNLALRVEGLGKMYRIGGKQERYATLRDTLTDAVTAPFKRARSLIRGEAYGAAGLKEEIWALKDVSFEVKHGEVVGIIGRNGAGKSTLLKILSRITEPTEGYAEVYGRVGSLLEVGTGFHPELTGRENIYLNGAILGMSRAEIDRKFDEIVDFAGIEKFIDTPVKHYSSGMGLRLGFAVAAHLEPEILVVDEVLAVGDAEFQKKCLGKMSDVAGEGRTVLFVSHNMGAVRNLCRRVIVLKNGEMSLDSAAEDSIRHYLTHTNTADVDSSNLKYTENRDGTGEAKIVSLICQNKRGETQTEFGIGEPFQVILGVEFQEKISSLVTGLEIRADDETPIANLRSDSQGIVISPTQEQTSLNICIDLPGLPLFPGVYYIDCWIASYLGKRIDHVYRAAKLTLSPQGFFEAEKLLQPGRGFLIMDCGWTTLNGVDSELRCGQ